MKLKDVPPSPAYLVCHDAFDRGAMEIWPMPSIEVAQRKASEKQKGLESMGVDDCCMYRAYVKLPRVKVWKYNEAKA